MYSGSVAGAVYARIELPDSIILIGPNHTGLGAPVSLMAKGSWETPLGRVEIDGPLAAAILSKSSRIHEDSLAHLREHSLEVQLPFIQYFRKDFKIVPIQMLDVRLETCKEVGKAVAEAIAEFKSAMQDVLIVASSDMTHYESARAAKEKDEKAIGHILDLDPDGLYRTVKDLGITRCGFGPAVAMLTACKSLGATKAELVKYTNSGEASGDFDQVVGYAGIVIM
jgi:AmmeMemoRadiSam system protein B